MTFQNTTHDRLPLRGRHCDPCSKHEQKLYHSLSPQAPSRARGLVQKWKISINPEKTEAVFFSAGHSTRKPPPIHVQNHPVPWSKSVNYLGVTLDKHLSFKDHIKINNKFRALACIYYPYFTRNSPLTIKNRMLIYTSILRRVLLYASPIWGHATQSNLNRLESSQNIIIRKLTNSPWFVRNEDLRFALNLKTVRETLLRK
ncbi:probable RNA-directed DNA polymerase from transposon X-element [Trichonephila clavipes]|nr:probable RNA-directed DNA polymerase from transposon X-element [Trichonephila clavipes]